MARVYVGTYGKYNAGNLAGMWIDLNDCDNYGDFLGKCKAAHKGERDPEYMIQDFEGFPDGLDCMEWLSESDFNDVKAALAEEEKEEAPAASFTVVDYSEKAIAVTGDTRPLAAKFKTLGGRFNPRLTCGAGWVFSKKVEADVRALLNGSNVETGKAAQKEKKQEGTQFFAALEEWLGTLRTDKDYYRKSTAAAVKLPEGFYTIEKPRIENRFCFHDEGPDYEVYKELHRKEENMRAYFLRKNLCDFDEKLKWLEEEKDPVFVAPTNYNNEAMIRTAQYSWDYNEARCAGWRQLTDNERKQIAGALRFVRDGFEKRLHTYLKKYGTAKIQTWTYWADA